MKPHHHHPNTTVFIIDDKKPRPFTVELTVVSAEGLDAAAAPISCCPFPRRRRLRPFASLTTSPPALWGPTPDCAAPVPDYRTGVGSRGGENPEWGHEFRVHVGPDFFARAFSSCLYLSVYDFRPGSRGRSLLGWCQIPAGDFGGPAAGALRQLSYRLKERDGTRGQGVVNVAVRVEGPVPAPGPLGPSRARAARQDTCRAVIGIPVGLHQRHSLEGERHRVTCLEKEGDR